MFAKFWAILRNNYLTANFKKVAGLGAGIKKPQVGLGQGMLSCIVTINTNIFP